MEEVLGGTYDIHASEEPQEPTDRNMSWSSKESTSMYEITAANAGYDLSANVPRIQIQVYHYTPICPRGKKTKKNYKTTSGTEARI